MLQPLSVKMGAEILHVTTATEARRCLACGKPLPPKSKMTVAVVSQEEADRRGWAGSKNTDGTVNVDLCLSCQMTHTSSAAKNTAPTSF
jgi:hypothetical protein